MKSIAKLSAIVLCGLILTGCTEEINNLNDSINELNEVLTSSDYLVLEEDTITTEADEYGFSYYINGYINNTSDTYSFDYVQVTFTTYDSEGNTIGTCIDNNSGLEAGGRWKFSAICLSDVENIATYKMTEITGW